MLFRRVSTSSRRSEDGSNFPFASSSHHKSRAPPLLPVSLLVVGGLFLVGYFYSGFGRLATHGEVSNHEGLSCSSEVQSTIPFLKKAYGGKMQKVLHVGPNACATVSKLAKEGDVEVWGIEPYDLDDASSNCKSLVHKGIVRVADIKFPLPYKQRSFSLVIVSDALDYLSTKYLNRTLPDLARVSMGDVVVFSGYPGQERGKVSEPSKIKSQAKLRSSSWWLQFFGENMLEQNHDATERFEQAVSEASYRPSCQIFHLRSNGRSLF